MITQNTNNNTGSYAIKKAMKYVFKNTQFQ